MPTRQGDGLEVVSEPDQRPLLPQHDRAAVIETDDVERVLAEIDPDYPDPLSCCRMHGVLLA